MPSVGPDAAESLVGGSPSPGAARAGPKRRGVPGAGAGVGRGGPGSLSGLMETIAPPVVAVIVTCDPGEWFEETLQAFASQDYPELSVLVIDAASAVDPTPRVGAVLPNAYVARLPRNDGFGATANQAMAMVQGASMLLFCHDDIAPDPDAVHVLVEESFRSNAGVVAPKLVSWDDPARLLHVGMAVDKGGAVVDRVEPGEIDHGQHDAVRDVFLAPGCCTLVRTDLFAELGGFDPGIFALGEDLDLCWRAQIMGARVVVAPGARVRHLELLASGRRALPGHVRAGMPGGGAATGGAGEAVSGVPGDGVATDGALQAPSAPAATAAAPGGPAAPVTLQALQRRHELLSALKAYGPWHRLRVLPQVAMLALAEWTVAVLAGHRQRAAAISHAWRWNLGRRRLVRAARAEVQAHRRLSDTEVRRLQLHGSARLNAYVRRAVTHGLEAANRGAAHAEASAATAAVGTGGAEAGTGPSRPRRRGGVDEPSNSTRWLVLAAAALVVVFGSRQLIGPGFPFVGQFLALPGWSTLLHRFASGWQPTGVGSTDPTSPAAGVLGVSGLVLFGSVGLLQKVVVLGCIPVGALGMARLVRPLGTTWARITAVVIYLAVPVPYDAIATARFDALVAYAACPWMLHLLGRISGVEPHRWWGRSGGDGRPTIPGSPERAETPDGLGEAAPPWRRPLVVGGVALGLLDAAVTALAPSTACMVLVLGLGLALGNVVVAGQGGLSAARRVVAGALGATALSVALLAPWSIAVLGGPQRWATLAGLPVAPASAPGWGQLLRLAVGPIGDDALGWAFLAAAALPLVIGARLRLAWAGRAWSVAVVAWLVAWLSGRGWLGPLALSPQVLLVPAAVAVALAVGLGVAAFQQDLPGYRFGWRQGAAVVAAAAAAVGVLPVLAASFNGHWDLVSTGYGEATSWMAQGQDRGDFRVLWIGDPRVLPGGGWELSPGLAYSLSENGLPDATSLWAGSDPGPAAAVADDVALARAGTTVRLGRLLAPYAVRYVVVIDTLAPSIPGLQSPAAHPPPTDLVPALASQLDLRQVISQGGFDVFVDDAALPERAVRVGAGAPAAVTPTGPARALAGWEPALGAAPGQTSVSGRVPAGTVFDAVAPAADWHLTVPGGRPRRATTAFGYAATFTTGAGVVTLGFDGSAGHGVELVVEVLLWLCAVAFLLGRRRLEHWRPRRAGAGSATPVAAPELEAVPSAAGVAASAPPAGVPDGPTPPVPTSAAPSAPVAGPAAAPATSASATPKPAASGKGR